MGLLVSTLGLAISFRLPVRIWQSLAAWQSLQLDSPASQATPFDGLKSFTSVFPLLLLLVWLAAAFWLLRGQPKPASANLIAAPADKSNSNKWLLWLVPVLLLGWVQRSAQLLPAETGRFPQPNYDEMVYYSSAAAFAAGHLPYREFFTVHPPGAFVVFAALFKLLGLENGGPNTFLAGRWFSLIQGLLTAAGVFWTAGRLWSARGEKFAPGAALIAGLVYALDGRAAEIAMLENVSNLCAVAGFICFIESERSSNSFKKQGWLIGAGALAGAAALSKLPGLALVFALLVYLLWRRDWRGFGRVSLGFGIVALLIEGPFLLLVGPGELLRQQLFFQLLRPQEVRAGIDQIARIAEYPEAALTLFLGGLGLCFVAWRVIVISYQLSVISYQLSVNNSQLSVSSPVQAETPNLELESWNLKLIPVLWSVPLLVIFSFSKSFHPWYFVQWALPLAVLAGGLWWGQRVSWYRWVLALAIALLALPLAIGEWRSEQKVDYDRVYGPAASYLKTQPSGAINLFALDPGYNLMAGLPSVRLPDGKFLIDGSSYLLYLNLDIDRRSISDLTGAVLGLSRDKASRDEIYARERGQTLVTLGLSPGGWTALDGKIALPQLTPRSVEYIAAASGPGLPIDYVTLYRVRSVPTLRQWRFDNGLWLTPFGLSTSLAGRANYDPPDPDGNISLAAKEAGSRTLDLRLGWRVRQSPTQQLKVFVHLIDQGGQRVAQRDLPPLSPTTDTRQWQAGQAFQDVQALPLPSNLSPGHYRVIMGLYAADSGQRISVEGQDSIELGYLEIK